MSELKASTVVADLANNVSAGTSTANQIDDFAVTVGTSVGVGATTADVNARLVSIRNDIYQLGQKQVVIIAALKAAGVAI